MSAYVVVQVDIKDPERFEDYRAMVPASLVPRSPGCSGIGAPGAMQADPGWDPGRERGAGPRPLTSRRR